MAVTEGASTTTEGSGLPDDEGRIDRAADAIRGMTKEMIQELTPRRLRFSEKLRQMTMEAPLHSLAIAFLLGVLVVRRP